MLGDPTKEYFNWLEVKESKEPATVENDDDDKVETDEDKEEKAKLIT